MMNNTIVWCYNANIFPSFTYLWETLVTFYYFPLDVNSRIFNIYFLIWVQYWNMTLLYICLIWFIVSLSQQGSMVQYPIPSYPNRLGNSVRVWQQLRELLTAPKSVFHDRTSLPFFLEKTQLKLSHLNFFIISDQRKTAIILV